MGGQEVLLAAAGLHRRGLRFLREAVQHRFPLSVGIFWGVDTNAATKFIGDVQ